jgi:hypothetical protein
LSEIFVGIDYSMRSPAMCIETPEKIEFLNLNGRKKLLGTYQLAESVRLKILPLPDSYANDVHRYAMISKPFMDAILEHTTDDDIVTVEIEGYSYGSKGSAIYNIAENCQTLKLRLVNEPRIKLVLPSPSPNTIKQFATGRGNAGKSDMGERFLTLTGIDVSKALYDASWDASPVSDIVDAFWICKHAKQSNKET